METVRIEDLNQPVEVPQGAIGVVEEIMQISYGTMRGVHLVFPGYPLPGANAQVGSFIIRGRVLHLLGPGERLTAEWAGLAVYGKSLIINDNGRARIERTGLARVFLGRGAKYKSAQPPCTPRS